MLHAWWQRRTARRMGRRLAARRSGAPPSFPELTSQTCTVEQMRTPEYLAWCDRLVCPNETQHRKAWEYCYIMQAVKEQIGLHEGLRALGFGVGRERLAEAFASFGCEVLATDQAADDARAEGWTRTNQYIETIAELNRLNICEPEAFRERVSFREVDMNDIPGDLQGFDIVWSACAFEHLGSIEHGKRFVLRAMDCLKPGGVAVHTTEFNLSSDDETVDHQGTVLFRRRDLEDLAERLRARGDRMLPLNTHPGSDPVDHFVDVPPYKPQPHLRLLIEGHAATSVGIIIRRGD